MDGSLFLKHYKVLTEKTQEKQVVLTRIQEATGVTFSPDEVSITKQEIVLTTTSVKKMLFKRNGGENLFKDTKQRIRY